MELLQLRYFCEAACRQSMTRAAEVFHVPQSAVSIAVARLEAELGVRLFDRVGNRVYLNEKGVAFLQQARQALTGLENACRQARDSAVLEGEVRLLVLSDRSWVAQRLLSFWRAYPAIRFSLCHNLYADQPFAFDLCVAAYPPREEELENQALFTENFVLAVPREHRLAEKNAVSLGELKQERFLLTPPGSSIDREISAACRSKGFLPKAALISDDPALIRRCVSEGMGIAFAPEISWQGLFDEKVVLIPLKDGPISRTVRLYWHKGRYLNAAARAVKDFFAGLQENPFGSHGLAEGAVMFYK